MNLIVILIIIINNEKDKIFPRLLSLLSFYIQSDFFIKQYLVFSKVFMFLKIYFYIDSNYC